MNSLNEGLQQPVSGILAIGGLVRTAMALGEILNTQEQVVLQPEGLTPAQRNVLVTLRREGPLTMSALARSRGFSRQNARVLVRALVQRGFLTLVSNPGHKRARLAEISPEGLIVLQRVLHREGEVLSRLASKITGKMAREATGVLADIATVLAAVDS